jgi:hypothetical protein
MSGMSDGVSKVWVLHIGSALRVEGFDSDRHAALGLAYRSLCQCSEAEARAAIEAFAKELQEWVVLDNEPADDSGERDQEEE